MKTQYKLAVFAALLGLITAGSFVFGSATAAAQSNCNPERDLTGQIGSNGTATITNNSATCSYKVGLAVYKKFDENISNQKLHASDSNKTLGPKKSMTLRVNLPSCAYQIDLFYGHLIVNLANERYGDRLVDFEHGGGNNYCVNIPTLNVSCTVSDTTVNVGQQVTYTANATGGTGSYTYSWTGSENLSASTRVVNKIYNSAGNKTARVTVTSGNQTASRDCQTVVVSQVQTPNPSVSCQANLSTADVGDTVSFTAFPVSGTTPYTYSWSGTDGISGTTKTISKQFNSAGTKTATVVLTDANGKQAQASCSTTIQQQNPGLGGSCTASPTSANVGQNINFSASGTGGTGNYTFEWLGLENNFTSQNFSTSFSSPGSKNVRVRISSGGQTVERSCPVNIEQPNTTNLNVSCDVSPSNPRTNQTVRWSSSVSGGEGTLQYQWTGDAQGNTPDVFESYNNDGNYSATVRVTDSQGRQDTATCNVRIDEDDDDDDDEEDLDVSCSVSDSRVKVGEDVTFSARADGGNRPYDYEWDGDDGLNSNDRTVRISYDSPGRKRAEVTVEDDDGDEETARCSVLVEDDQQEVTVITESLPTPPQSYVYLNQVPYTGAGDKLKLISFAVMLAFWSIFIAYMIIRKRARRLAMGYVNE
jgi:hypothetical protein